MPSRALWSRRELCAQLGLVGAASLVAPLAGCDDAGRPLMGPRDDEPGVSRGRLSFRPKTGRAAVGRTPRTPFRVDTDLGTFALVHPPQAGGGPVRLVVLLHGAGGNPERTVHLLGSYADPNRLLVVAPKSYARTWDVITGRFGPDVQTVDELLLRLSARYPVRGRTIAGFSDGASYALSLGIANGDVFDSILAFSPGFEAAQVSHGRPRIFVSHGTGDRVLPIERCSRRLVPALERDGYDVTYHEFEGGHEVPLEVRERAVDWLDGSPSA
jgi:predicted esterase